LALMTLVLASIVGCGTTRTTNTLRTATEQLLISDAIDRAVQEIDFSPLAGETVYFHEGHLYEVVDSGYLISSLRQHLLASGCILKENREEALYVIEPRAGVVGTDSHNLLFGFPATNVPQVTLLSALPPAIPEIPIAKRRNQRGVAKIAVFAYRRETGEPAWQSGIVSSESTANDVWVLGAGPFERGTIHQGTSFAGRKLTREEREEADSLAARAVKIEQQAVFGQVAARNFRRNQAEGGVRHASAELPLDREEAELEGARLLPPPGAEANLIAE